MQRYHAKVSLGEGVLLVWSKLPAPLCVVCVCVVCVCVCGVCGVCLCGVCSV